MVVLALALLLPLSSLLAARSASASPAASIQSKLPKKRLFDLGVADPGRDGQLDLFTTNHKFKAVLLQNRGGGRFRDRLVDWGLSQTPQFPGLGSLQKPASMSAPGVYIWLTDRTGEPGKVHIAAVGRSAEAEVKTVAHASAVVRGAASADVERLNGGARRISLSLRPGGKAVLSVSSLGELPVSFDFRRSSGLRPADVALGRNGVSPDELLFRVQLHDRHGFAFHDVNGDGVQDLFVVSGGAGGRIGVPRFGREISDQLLLSDRGSSIWFAEGIHGSGIEKNDCRGREAEWIDYDGDGVLDLFVTCENRSPVLSRGLGGGRFEPGPSPPIEDGTFRWLDLGGPRPNLVVGRRESLEVWSYDGGWWLQQSLSSGRRTSQIVAGDIDNDGRSDLLVVAAGRVRAYLNTLWGLRELDARELGLPRDEVGIALADVDNDGWLDLPAAKRGVMLWDRGRGRFVRTGIFARRGVGYAILNWPDLDNDGRRELVAAYSGREFSARSKTVVRAWPGKARRWLQVDLTGAAGNREGIGARVIVRPLGRRGSAPRRITQFVGQNEGSRHSQGHYRTYFGLGRAKRARLTVVWPDGSRTVKRGMRTNRLLTVRK